MNKNVVIGIAAVAVLGLGGYIVYTKLKKPATVAATAPGSTATTPTAGSNANSTNWLTTIGSLFGDLGHINTGNSTSPTNNTSTAAPVTTDNSGTDWDTIIGDDDGYGDY